MRADWLTTSDPEKFVPDVWVIDDIRHLRSPARRSALMTPPRRKELGLFGGAMAGIIDAVMQGFVLCAWAMYPEHFHRADEPTRPSPDELADDAPRSWRSDVNLEPREIVCLRRIGP